MTSALLKRRSITFAFIAALVLGALPLAVSADHHQATRVSASFTATTIEEINPGEEWVDDAGIFHIRGLQEVDEFSGDITGSGVVTINIDFWTVGECSEESCPGFTEVWGDVSIDDESGSWTGRWIQSYSDVPGEEYAFTSIALHGHGGNAGKSFFGEFAGEDEASVTIEGILSTMATPVQAMNTSVTLCFTDGPTVGNYLSSGVIEGFGSAEGIFIGSGTRWTHTYNLFGVVELANEGGTVQIGFVAGAQDVSFSSFGFGTYTIIGGTGDYAELYGNGRVIGAAQNLSHCEFGYGVRLSLIGGAHYNSK